METPFIFGKVTCGNSFVNRQEELKRLSLNFTSTLNTILVSPRRWGKSSLVKKVAETVENTSPNVRVCLIDMFAINSEDEFYKVLATEVLKKTSNRWEEWVSNGKKFLKRIVPVFSVGVDPASDFSVKFEIEDNDSTFAEILNLPENIAINKGMSIVICIDEVQKVSQFPHSLAFQQKLRSVWQHHQHVCYCLYGSKRHVVSDMFQNQSMPFYRFGDTMYLQKIDRAHWVPFIQEAFEQNGKRIAMQLVERIIEITANHPYYIQQLCHHVYANTALEASPEILDYALNEIFLYNEIMYRREIENLTPIQVNLLRAIAYGEKMLTAVGVVRKYGLGSSGNVSRAKQALEAKEIVDFFEAEPEFVDPLFAHWIRLKLKSNI